MKTVLVVSTPFLEELRERAALATQNDEAQTEAMYLTKAADEIERQQAMIARLLKTVVDRNWHLAPPTAKTNGVKLYRSLIEVNHGDHEYTVENYFAAKNEREAQAYANRHASKLFVGTWLDAENCWSTSSGDIAWSLLNVSEARALHVSGADGKVHVFDVACRLPVEARYDSKPRCKSETETAADLSASQTACRAGRRVARGGPLPQRGTLPQP